MVLPVILDGSDIMHNQLHPEMLLAVELNADYGCHLTIDVPLFIPSTVRSSGCPADVPLTWPFMSDVACMVLRLGYEPVAGF